MDNLETFESIEPIAIIGMAGRFPGAKNVEEFWQNLCNGVESISFFSDEELAAAGVDLALLNNPNYVKANAVLEDIEMFDASFFGFTPREAQAMDPQQRLLLECAWNALENAGYDSQTYPGRIGIYAGSSMSSYLYRNLSSNPDLLKLVDFDWLQQQDPISLGNDRDYLTTRISYKLGLTGPSMSINTACSTSLVAVHTACQSLLNYQCEMALAGGVSIQVPQTAGYLYREGGIASPDGHCRTFDAKAQGTLFCSGLGLVLLKRLEDALADGDYIYAVIKGSAINNDGTQKVSYTAPSVDGQVGVITEALAVAGISPETISYMEAHGTGTALGDPIEVAAMTQAFRASTDKKGFCAIGSVKPNVGHLNRAAGIASLIKTVMALKHQLIPPSLNYEQPNPNLDFANSPFFVNTTRRQWQTNGTPRRAGVTSLGFGGTNAHAVLEEAPVTEPSDASRSWQLLLLSAKTDSALEAATKNLAAHLKQHPDLNLADVAYTLQVGRRGFNHRRMLVCRDLADAVTALETLDPKRIVTQSQEPKERSVAFMFSGQGSQYVNMALELYQLEPTFREQIDLCAEILQPYLGSHLGLGEAEPPGCRSQVEPGNETIDLRDLLYPREDKAQEAAEQLKQTSITQPALFAIEYALAKLWMSWGIHPAATIGHSIGEYVAACIAGVFSLEDALSLVAARGKMMQQMPPGSMIAVPLSERELQPYLGNNLSLALINGPSRCVVSGTGEAIDGLEKQLAAQGVEGRRLYTSHAFHSEMMEPVLDSFAELVKKVTLHPPEIPYVSNVTGTWITAEQATDPNYWAKHLRQTVRFAEGLQQLFQDADQILLEVGPGRTLSTLALQHPDKPSEQVVLTSVRHPQESQSDLAFLLNTLGKLWLAGVQVDWSGFYEGERRHRLPLPTYAFDLKRHWIEANEVSIHKSQILSRTSSKNIHPLLGQKLSLAGTEDIRFEALLSLDWQAFLKHHCFFETAILPASGYLEMALAAGVAALKSDRLLVEDLVIHQALVLPEDEVKTVQLILSPIGDKMYSFRIFSLTGDESENPGWMLHACGRVLVGDEGASRVDLGALQAQCGEELAIASYYQNLQARGLNYDRLFQGIEKLMLSPPSNGNGGGSISALAQIRLPEELVATASDYHLHPILLDASFQLLGVAFPDDKQFTYPLVGLDRLQVYHRPGTSLWSQVVVHPAKDSQTISADLHLYAPDGQIIAKIEGIKLKRQRCEAWREALQDWLYEVEWRPVAQTAEVAWELNGSNPRNWLILAESQGIGQQLATKLRSQGEICTLVFAGKQYQQLCEQEFSIDPANPTDWRQLLATLGKEDAGTRGGGDAGNVSGQLSASPRLPFSASPLHGVVHLWSLDAVSAESLTSADLGVASQQGCGSTLSLVQSLVSGLSELPSLWLVTRGAVPAGCNMPGVAQSALWGMGKVIALEHPELHCVRVDLDPNARGNEAQELFEEVWLKSQEDEVAWRDRIRQVSRLVHSHQTKNTPKTFTFREDSTYLITGGTGGLGLLVARWMVEKGAKHLVLVSRSGSGQIEELEQMGAEVVVAKADVTQPEEVARIIREIEQSQRPLRGVIHAAGVVDNGTLGQLDWERFAKVLNPKLAGAWNLHLLTGNLPLDFFVMFSSVASLVGHAGQANHSAANGFLDALAYHRRSKKLPGLSINWGSWSEVGAVATSQAATDYMKARGMEAIAPQQGLQVLEELLGQNAAQIGVVSANWSKFLEQFPADAYPPLFSDLAKEARQQAKGQSMQLPTAELMNQLQTATPEKQRELLIAYLQIQVTKVLGLDASNPPEAHHSLNELGLDSLTSIQLRNWIRTDIKVDLPMKKFIVEASIDQLANALLEQLALASITLIEAPSADLNEEEEEEVIRL
ncbi:type I polyketide synthase [Microseira sp. BLCC-F43]|jgi:acyl transferase domain-containing protein/acyl carrier protein|uniref:type I polyketide synthase n=1 Tax=Microseira sp. BLCC-F43 TaxID=3153602 RepID=UPI0035B6E0FF